MLMCTENQRKIFKHRNVHSIKGEVIFIKEGTNKETSATVENLMDIIYLPYCEQVSEVQENDSSASIEALNQKLWSRTR